MQDMIVGVFAENFRALGGNNCSLETVKADGSGMRKNWREVFYVPPAPHQQISIGCLTKISLFFLVSNPLSNFLR